MGLDIGTGRVSSYCLQEELTPKIIGANPASKVWFRRRRNSYQPMLSYVPTNIASAYDASSQGLAVESTIGMHEIEIDMRSIGWLFKSFFGAYSKSSAGGVTTHVFIPGSSEKTFQILENKGGFTSAYLRKYQGMFPNRITLNTGINDWLWASVGLLGLDEVTGTDPGTPAPETDTSVMAGFNQIQYYIGTVGSATIVAMGDPWTDANDMRLDLTRPDAIADDFRSDKTGKSSSIFPGTFTPAINLMSRFASTHKLATFDNRTKVAFGVKVDTGTHIVGDTGQHYALEFIFPRCTIQSYSIDFQGAAQSVPVMSIVPEIDPTATWSTKAILYNNISDYASPT